MFSSGPGRAVHFPSIFPCLAASGMCEVWNSREVAVERAVLASPVRAMLLLRVLKPVNHLRRHDIARLP